MTDDERNARFRYVRSRMRHGLAMTAIAGELRIHPVTLREWMDAESRRRAGAPKPPPPPRMVRACLRCREEFTSEKADGAFLRMCGYCRRTASTGLPEGAITNDGRRSARR